LLVTGHSSDPRLARSPLAKATDLRQSASFDLDSRIKMTWPLCTTTAKGTSMNLWKMLSTRTFAAASFELPCIQPAMGWKAQLLVERMRKRLLV
jgi:hypothetical protein